MPERLAANSKLDEAARPTLALVNDSATRQQIELTIALAMLLLVNAQLPLHQCAVLNPLLPIRLANLPELEAWLLKPAELRPQTIELPLAEFVRANPAFKPARLVAITWQFERRTAGAMVLDEVGFSREH